jgi:hypothetical protein
VYFFGGFTLLLAFGRIICSVVTCEGGITTLSCNPLPSQNPRSSGTSPLGLTSLNRKNHPIVVTLGGNGSYYASLTFKPQAFYPCYKLCDNVLASLSGNTESNLPQDDNLSVSLASRVFYLTRLPGDSTRVFSLFFDSFK